MTKDTPAKEIDIELKDYRCLMLMFEGRNTQTGKMADDVLGVFADPRVIAND